MVYILKMSCKKLYTYKPFNVELRAGLPACGSLYSHSPAGVKVDHLVVLVPEHVVWR
jgi:hypothetical protein